MIQKENYLRELSDNWSMDMAIQPPKPNLRAEYLLKVREVEQLRGKPLFYPYLGSGRGRGVYVELLDGSVKMDLIGGAGVHILGHSHPELMQVAKMAAESNVVMQGHLVMNQEYLTVSRKLVQLASRCSRLRHVWLCTSGSMANENALKMIRQRHYFQSGGRRKTLAFDRAFAGRTIMMSEICGNPAVREGMFSYGEVLHVPFYNKKHPERSLSILKSHLEKEASNIAAFIFEIILGEGGICSAPPEFFIDLFKECRKHGITIWADEVQTFCRTGSFFAFEKLGLGEYIDLCTVGKSLQFAATFCTSEYNPRPGLVAGTFCASTSSLAAGMKILELMESKYLECIPRIEVQLRQMFKELYSRGWIQDYDVFGLMVAFTLKDSSKKNTLAFLQKLFTKGVIAFFCSKSSEALVNGKHDVYSSVDVASANDGLLEPMQPLDKHSVQQDKYLSPLLKNLFKSSNMRFAAKRACSRFAIKAELVLNKFFKRGKTHHMQNSDMRARNRSENVPHDSGARVRMLVPAVITNKDIQALQVVLADVLSQGDTY